MGGLGLTTVDVYVVVVVVLGKEEEEQEEGQQKDSSQSQFSRTELSRDFIINFVNAASNIQLLGLSLNRGKATSCSMKTLKRPPLAATCNEGGRK